jgi:hypothetical protein
VLCCVVLFCVVWFGVAQYQAEMERMEVLKVANAKVLVEQSRTQIAKLWTDLHFAEDSKRAAFPAFWNGISPSPHSQRLLSSLTLILI